jgi:hypothetical protein
MNRKNIPVSFFVRGICITGILTGLIVIVTFSPSTELLIPLIFASVFLSLTILCFNQLCGVTLRKTRRTQEVELDEIYHSAGEVLHLPSTEPTKTITLSPKQVLGLDDDTFLSTLPDHECECPNPRKQPHKY